MEKDFLERCLSEGMSLDQIAEAAGKHPSTVSYHLKKHGLVANGAAKHAPNGRIDEVRLRALVGEGLSLRQIAKTFGVSYTAVRHRCRAIGLETSAKARDSRFQEARGVGDDRYLRNCPRHGETLFGPRPDGGYRCLRCRQEGVVLWRRRLKERLIKEAGGCCVICGYDAHAGALQFHHLIPEEKSFGLAQGGLTRSLEAIRVEAAKCVLLCSNCHAEVEAGETEIPIELLSVKLSPIGPPPT